MSERTVVIGHFDGHGVCASAVVARSLNASEVYCKYPETSPESLVTTLQNMFAAAPSKLSIYVVDVPVDLKNPIAFIEGLEQLARIHDITLIDHHETSVPHLQRFSCVKVIFIGASAYEMVKPFIRENIDERLAVIGAICDRDAEVIRNGKYSNELQRLADGIDVLVRRDALAVVKGLVENPERVLEDAMQAANMIPSAELDTTIGVVALAKGTLPEQWGPKALEKLAFNTNAWYAVGYSYSQRFQQWIVRAIIRWDVAASRNLPMPKDVAARLWPTRNIIGHPAAPSIAATSEGEAKEMARRLAEELANAVTGAAAPSTVRLISEGTIGQMLADILIGIQRILENQQRLYEHYLELKRRQVELLERASEQRARYD